MTERSIRVITYHDASMSFEWENGMQANVYDPETAKRFAGILRKDGWGLIFESEEEAERLKHTVYSPIRKPSGHAVSV